MSAPEFLRNHTTDSSHGSPAPDRAAAPSWSPSSSSALARFIGGPPAVVFVRLLFISLIVGAALVWLDVRPYDILFAIQSFGRRVWMMGWGALGDIAQYALAGAAVVLPIWLVLRLMNMRSLR